MSKHVKLLVVLALFSGLPADAQNCGRFTPEELWYSDHQPLVNTTLEEIRVYFEHVFAYLDVGLFNFMPHVSENQTEADHLIELTLHTKRNVTGVLDEVYRNIEGSWFQLFDISYQILENETESQSIIRKMEALQEAYVRGNLLLDNMLRELVSFFQILVEQVIEGASRILENELDEEPEGEAATAQLLQDKINELASADFLGMIVSRLLGRGLGTLRKPSKESTPVLLNEIIKRIDQLLNDFKSSNTEPRLRAEKWEEFWRRVFDQSLEITTERAANGKEDFHKIFGNNMVYMVEIMLNLMTFYAYEE